MLTIAEWRLLVRCASSHQLQRLAAEGHALVYSVLLLTQLSSNEQPSSCLCKLVCVVEVVAACNHSAGTAELVTIMTVHCTIRQHYIYSMHTGSWCHRMRSEVPPVLT